MNLLEKRKCPVCQSIHFDIIYTQSFKNILGININNFKQNIAICQNCGMIYTNPFISDQEINNYYSCMSSYEYDDNNNEYPEVHKRRSKNQYEYIKNYIDTSKYKSVLDVGCALGYTLSLFKNEGFKTLGLEPSEKNKKIAKIKYDVDIETSFLTKKGLDNRKFDIIILSHVAEHLKYPLEILENIRIILNDNGLIYIEVPDIDLFDEQDLYQFSFEHINYFNINSLKNMMYQNGFQLVNKKIFYNDKSVAPFYPTLGTIWEKSNKKFELENYYEKNKKTIQKYIDLINNFRGNLVSKIDTIIKSHNNIAIWAAGTLTSQLLSQTNLLKGDIKAIFDNDSKKAGLKMENIEIYKPELSLEYFKNKNIEVIIIGSWSSQNEIYTSLLFLEEFNIKIIKLFNE